MLVIRLPHTAEDPILCVKLPLSYCEGSLLFPLSLPSTPIKPASGYQVFMSISVSFSWWSSRVADVRTPKTTPSESPKLCSQVFQTARHLPICFCFGWRLTLIFWSLVLQLMQKLFMALLWEGCNHQSPRIEGRPRWHYQSWDSLVSPYWVAGRL